jgi:hypothetical protein
VSHVLVRHRMLIFVAKILWSTTHAPHNAYFGAPQKRFSLLVMTGFGFVEFQEYFLCNFSETQKQQKTGNWHCGDLLIGQFRKMHKSAMKCNKKLSKWCKNKHEASKIMDTLETYH